MEIPNLYLWTKAKKEYQKLNSPIWVAVILTDNQLPFLFVRNYKHKTERTRCQND